MPFDLIAELQSWLQGAGAWAYVLAPAVMTVVAIFPFPAEIPAMINGMLFGPAVGTVVTWTGSMLGAWVSFELSRRFGRPLTRRFLSDTALTKVDRVAGSAGAPGLLLLRLIPIIAFTVLNWAAGLTVVKRSTFLWTTALGILPGALVFTVSGTGLAAVYRRRPILGLAVIAAAILVIGFTYRRYRSRGSAARDVDHR